ncbi:MAG TPA: hypothetical protein DER07_04650, partial [Armatimonadetes bacterium]|nr:hypothetical protein [Armatimonadota bacterium]
TTDSPKTWQTAWAGVRKLHHPASWASAIHYPGASQSRAPLDTVLAQTRSPNGPFLDIILTPGRSPIHLME